MAVAPTEGGIDVIVMGCKDKCCNFEPMRAKRRDMGPQDVLFDLVYCGVCHTDLGWAADHRDMGSKTIFPCIPGHELAGIVTQVGSEVKKFKAGDPIGVGCLVESCMKCKNCKAGRENMCMGMVMTYQAKSKNGMGETFPPKQRTMGGYTNKMVVHEHFGIKLPEGYPLEYAGPIMCAGVTMYSPMKFCNVAKGSKVGIVGLGGLGITGLRIAKALECEVWAISRNDKKKQVALDSGAGDLIASSDEAQMKSAEKSFDLIIDTIPIDHNPRPYQKLLKGTGILTMIGMNSTFFGTFLAEQMTCCGAGNMHASGIGGIPDTQEIVDLCAKHNITPNVKIMPVTKLNEIYETLGKGNDDGIRYVLDIKNTLSDDIFDQCKDMKPPTLPDHKGNTTCCKICCFCCKQACCRCIC